VAIYYLIMRYHSLITGLSYGYHSVITAGFSYSYTLSFVYSQLSLGYHTVITELSLGYHMITRLIICSHQRTYYRTLH